MTLTDEEMDERLVQMNEETRLTRKRVIQSYSISEILEELKGRDGVETLPIKEVEHYFLSFGRMFGSTMRYREGIGEATILVVRGKE